MQMASRRLFITEQIRIDELYRRVGQALTSDELKGEVVAEYFRTKVLKNATVVDATTDK